MFKKRRNATLTSNNIYVNGSSSNNFCKSQHRIPYYSVYLKANLYIYLTISFSNATKFQQPQIDPIYLVHSVIFFLTTVPEISH